MKSYKRSSRVKSQILSGVADLVKKKINDPRLESATVTGVKVSDDLRNAYIYFTVYAAGPERERLQAEALKGFESASGFIRKMLAKQLGIRYMPKISFFHDGSFDYGAKMEQLLKDMNIPSDETE